MVLLFTLNLTCLSFGQPKTDDTGSSLNLKAALGFEFLSRTVGWNGDDANTYTSKLKSFFFTLNTQFEIQESLFLGLILGYSSSNYDEMTFRELPFSVELDVNYIGGFLIGGEIRKNFSSQGNFEVGLFGQFVYCLGLKKEWEIPGLSVLGKVEGNPTWMRAVAGPLVTYQMFTHFYPYLFLNINYLAGTFEIDQTVQTLTGNEKKKFSGEGLVGISLGTIYEVTDLISLKGEASVFPYKDGLDFGFIIHIVYSF